MGSGGTREDIEGLRAVAVLLVVACHAGVPGFAGGYLGVDVFFVISGYLITLLLQREWQQTGTLDLPAFYARRIRRLLPAFAVLMVAVLAGIYLLASPPEQPGLVRTVLAAALYISNLHFAWQATDYWGAEAKQDPLLHTWSLGVEEQFYLAWPLLLALLLAGAPRWRRLCVPLGVAASAALALYWMQGRPPEAFFNPLARAWEFGVGASLALFPVLCGTPGTGRRRRLLEAAGLLLILVPAFFYDGTTAFPGIAALPPVLGTALVLAAGATAPAGSASLLAARPLQWLGSQSYGWYLWHWPVLVFGLMLVPGAPSWLKLLWAVAALLPAYLSYRTVEAPLRARSAWARPRVALPLLIVVSALLLAAGLQVGGRADSLRGNPEYEALLATRGRVPPLYAQGCDPGLAEAAATPCAGGAPDGRRLLVLVGDSHAGQWASAFDAIAHRHGWRLLMYTRSACPMVEAPFSYPALGRRYHECEAWRRDAVAAIAAMKPDLLVMSNAESYPFSLEQWRQGQHAVMAALSPASRHVVILRDSPLPGLHIPNCLARRLWQPALYREDCSFATATASRAWVAAVQREVAAGVANATYLDPVPLICPAGRCPVKDGEVMKFRDANHLSDAYARQLAPALESLLRQRGLL